MSGPAFTQGPWQYTATVAFHDRPDLPCVVDEHGLVVAQCWDDGHSEEECEANAHLIAAAPDLYEALELADYLLSGANMNKQVVEKKVRSALAKARGE